MLGAPAGEGRARGLELLCGFCKMLIGFGPELPSFGCLVSACASTWRPRDRCAIPWRKSALDHLPPVERKASSLSRAGTSKQDRAGAQRADLLTEANASHPVYLVLEYRA